MKPVMTLIRDLLANQSAIGSALWELIAIYNAGELSPVSLNQIARTLRKDRRSVSRNIHRLVDCGLIEQYPGHGEAARYRVTLTTPLTKTPTLDKITISPSL